MTPDQLQRVARLFAFVSCVLACFFVVWMARSPGKPPGQAGSGGKGSSSHEFLRESTSTPDDGPAPQSSLPPGAGAEAETRSAPAIPPSFPPAAPVTLASSSAGPLPTSLDLRRLPLAPRKDGRTPDLVLSADEAISALENLFSHEPGDTVEVALAGAFRLTGELLRKSLQPGTHVLGISIDGESSTLHLERSRRGSYRGSIIHRRSPLAHRIETLEDGSLVVEQRSFSDLLCSAKDATPESSSGIPAPEGIEAAGPEESGVGEAPPPVRDSRPSATAVIYLDFDGQTVSGTEWNTLRNITTINAAASALSTAQMDSVWAEVAEDFAPFNVSVTTNASRYTGAAANRRIRIIVTPTSSWYGSAGGVAYLGSFTWSGDTPCWVFEDRLSYIPTYVALAASHEAGHTFNLKHDGFGTEAYYGGVDNSLVSWGPIMGNPYDAAFTQWSKGEYSSATNLEDDLAIIANSTNGFGYRTDDKGDTLASAPSLALQAGSNTLVSDSGVIEKSTDLDLIRVSSGAGTISLQVRPAVTAPNLYLKADLLDSGGNVLLSRTAARTATTLTLSQSVAAGTYYLRVDGTGLPVTGGSSPPYAYDVSGYGSVGEYVVTGSIPQPSASAVLSVDPRSITQSSPAGQNAGNQSFTVRNAGGGNLAYTVSESLSWLAVSPTSGNSSGANVVHTITYTSSGLSVGTYTGDIIVGATGASGSPQTIAVTLTVTPTGSGLTFSNAGAVVLPGSGSVGQGSPYPSNISVTGVTQPIASVSVELRNLQHSWTQDLDLLLEGPNGQNVMLLSDAGGGQPIAGGEATLIFRDDASTAPESAQLSGGTYRPTNYGSDDILPSPAPGGPHGTSLASLLSGGVNGTWRLYAFDDFPSADGGQILNGWTITLVPSSGPAAPTGVSATDGTQTDRVRITWSASSGATDYQVFRSAINNSTSATSIGTTASTTFDDLTTAVGETNFYWVTATNSGGTSPFSASDAGFRGASLTSNDAFANRATLAGSSGSVSASNTGATKESGEPNHAGNVGGKSLWWSWTAPQAGTLSVDTVGSSFDTLLGVYTGGSVSALTARGSDDDSGGNLTSRTTLQVDAGTVYAVAVDGYNGASGTVTLGYSFVATPQPPSPPPSISASDGTFSDRIRVTWSAGAGATSYDLRRHTSSTFASSTAITTTDQLTFDDTTAIAGTTYYYWVVAKNSSGSSSPAGPDAGSRSAPLFNDNFANRTLLTGNSTSVTASNASATKEGAEPNHGGNAGGRSLWWRWAAPSAGTLTVDTIGSGFDTLLGVYTGSSVSALTVRGSDDDSGGNLTSRVTLLVTGGTEYQIAADGYGGASGSIRLQLSFQPSATLPSPPGGVSASDDAFGDRVRINWTAGSGATSYEVYRHTSASFASATLLGNVATTTYDDLTAVAGTTYSYWVVSRNTVGTSSPAGPDTGRRAGVMPNNLFSFRAPLSGNNVSASGDSGGAGKEAGEPDHAGNTGGNSLWWTWTAPSAGTLTIRTSGSNFDTLLAVYTGANVSGLTEVASNDDFGGAVTSRVVFGTTVATTYHIAVDGFRGASGNVQLELEFQPSSGVFNDHFADRQTLSGEFVSVTGNGAQATAEPGEPSHGGYAAVSSLWWSWTAPRQGIVTFNTVGSGFDTLLGVYLGESLDSLFEIAGNDDAGGFSTSEVSFEVFAGEVFAIAVDGYLGASGNVVLNIGYERPPVSPTFLRARGMRGGKVVLSWNPGVHATTYWIERRDPGSRRWRVVGRAPSGSLRFVETRLQSGRKYLFRVRAGNDSGFAAPSPIAGARPR